MMKETFGPMINSTNGLGNKEETHVSRGFSNSLLISIVPIGFILLIAFYLCVYENISNYQRRKLMTDDGSSIHSSFYEGGISFTPKLTIVFIKGMSPFIVEEPEKMKDACSICIEDYMENDKIVKLSCGHEFHKDCIYPWFRQQAEGDIVLCVSKNKLSNIEQR